MLLRVSRDCGGSSFYLMFCYLVCGKVVVVVVLSRAGYQVTNVHLHPAIVLTVYYLSHAGLQFWSLSYKKRKELTSPTKRVLVTWWQSRHVKRNCLKKKETKLSISVNIVESVTGEKRCLQQ